MKQLNVLSTQGGVLFCKRCSVPIRAGASWWLFCPKCLAVEEPGVIIKMIMSCAHCRKPLVIKKTEDGRTVGRCHTDGCGDCHSMQDLCLVPLPKQIG